MVRAVFVRWTFIYFTTSWIDSEHLQRAGPAPAKLNCVYTLGRLGEKPATGEMRPRGAGANHRHFSCLAKSLEEESKLETNPSLLHAVPITPDAASLLTVFLNIYVYIYFFSKRGEWGLGLQLCLNQVVVICFLID